MRTTGTAGENNEGTEGEWIHTCVLVRGITSTDLFLVNIVLFGFSFGHADVGDTPLFVDADGTYIWHTYCTCVLVRVRGIYLIYIWFRHSFV